LVAFSEAGVGFEAMGSFTSDNMHARNAPAEDSQSATSKSKIF
jgi:hypothetical protein